MNQQQVGMQDPCYNFIEFIVGNWLFICKKVEYLGLVQKLFHIWQNMCKFHMKSVHYFGIKIKLMKFLCKVIIIWSERFVYFSNSLYQTIHIDKLFVYRN
jgi:hypothetical protein